MKDNENKYLQSVLEANAQTNATKNVEKKIKTRSHVVDANRQQQVARSAQKLVCDWLFKGHSLILNT